MSKRLKVGFIWQGINGVYGRWNDGLRGAMLEVEKHHDVTYFDTDGDWSAMDILLYWEAPVTECGKDRENYLRVKNSPQPRILLFAGGQIKREWVQGFAMLLVESQINVDECNELGIPNMTAFGVNTDIMKPEKQPKAFDAVFPSTCAGWKRQGLFSRALRSKGVICGRWQKEDPIGFIQARENNTVVLPELPYEAVNALYNASHCCVNTSEYWGGGQRTTLEALAAGVPVIVMSDSPKNREYVEECGYGLVCEPDEESIRRAVEEIKTWEPSNKGREYVENKWTHRHYAENIMKAIDSVMEKKP
jgi:hypothetical protein